MAGAFPPAGFDRADGTGGHGGTATLFGARVVRPSTTFFEEDPNSPEIERAEQITARHTFYADPTTAQTVLLGCPRGLLRVDSSGNYWRILSSTMGRQKGDRCTLVTVEEGIGSDTPPDECQIDVVEINPAIEEHPRYSQNSFGAGTSLIGYNINSTTGAIINGSLANGPQIVQACYQAANSGSVLSGNEMESVLNSSQITTASVLTRAKELIKKLKKHISSFYLAGFRVSYSRYFWLPRSLHPGGAIQDPVTVGGLPSYFWSDDGSGSSASNIFENLAHSLNPTIYTVADSSTGKYLLWLRQADQQTHIRSLVKITATWIGGPLGRWDPDLYYTHTPSP